MLLKNLIDECPDNIKKIDITGLALNSGKVKKGFMFFAIKGNNINGNKFINAAIKKGAKVIISTENTNIKNFKIPVIKVKDIKGVLSKSCERFFNLKPKNIIAVTGTNGKSSVADFFHQILSLNKIPVASIGTLGIKKRNKIKNLVLTSPDIITLHEELAILKKSKINNVIIEASSHGLNQGRLDGINYKAGIFTNFSQDHLDYHKSMKNYLKAKMILFSKLLKKNKFIITDKSNKEYSRLLKIARKKKLKLMTINQKKLQEKCNLSNLIGLFQGKNLSMAILAAKIIGLNHSQIKSALSKIQSVNGRLQLIRNLPNNAEVYIDYAHTPDALHTALKSLKEYYDRDITLVFGCGGERDIEKRSLMAKVARKFCKKIIVTDDNPRRENPKKIRKEIIKNLKNNNSYEISDRSKAIKKALTNSATNEIILVAGKGHEIHQYYGNKIINISDKKIIKSIKINKNKSIKSKLNQMNNTKILDLVTNKKNQIKFEGVSIDSRKIKKNNLFVAIKGKKQDGHKFIHQAIEKGASCCVVSRKINKINKKKIIKVKNTNYFLKTLASAKRSFSNSKVIGITGSAGKTSVKTLLGNLLNNYGSTYFSPRSFNNHFGVPLSLANLENNHIFGVFEIGMSRKGEIKTLSSLVKPNIAIITNIAEAHLENFKNVKGIASAKSEIIDNVKKGGLLILNRDDIFFNFLNNLGKKKRLKIITFGNSKKSDIFPVSKKEHKEFLFYKIKIFDKDIIVKTKNVEINNILISLAVLNYLRLDIKKITQSDSFLSSLEGRGKISKVKRYSKKFLLVDESYNANPLSVKKAINTLSSIKKKGAKKYILLGDMLELGNKSDFYHKNLAKVINITDVNKVFVYGNKILNTYKYIRKNKKGKILTRLDDFDKVFSKLIKKNDYLMIKGSNATGLNKLCRKIIKGRINAI